VIDGCPIKSILMTPAQWERRDEIYDYTVAIPAENIGHFREILRAGSDSMGEDETEEIELASILLRQMA